MSTNCTTSAASALLVFIEEENKKTTEWLAVAPGRFAGLYPESISYWNEMGIFTPEDLKKYEMKIEIFEATREIFGYKPSWAGLEAMSLESLKAEVARLGSAVQERKNRAEAFKKESVRIANEKALRARKVKQKLNKSFSLWAAFENAGL